MNMQQIRFLLIAFLLMSGNYIFAQISFPYNGVDDPRTHYYAITDAKIYVSSERVLEDATLIVKDGKIVEVGTNIAVPKEAITLSAEGMNIYPSFIDLYSDYGLEDQDKKGNIFC